MIYTIDEIRKTLKRVLKDTPVQEAVLFGSYAKGEAIESSDIDLLIDSKGALRGLDFFGVYDVIDEAFSIPVDVLEKRELIPGGRVEQEIQKTGIRIYEREHKGKIPHDAGRKYLCCQTEYCGLYLEKRAVRRAGCNLS